MIPMSEILVRHLLDLWICKSVRQPTSRNVFGSELCRVSTGKIGPEVFPGAGFRRFGFSPRERMVGTTVARSLTSGIAAKCNEGAFVGAAVRVSAIILFEIGE